jgi:hypothetical protein
MPDQAPNVSLEEVTQAAVSGVLRALDARNLDKARSEEFPWSVLIGLVMNPGKPFLTTLSGESDDQGSGEEG